MKLSKAEIAAIIITLIFICFTAAVSLKKSGGSATVTISAEHSEASQPPDSQTSISPEDSTSPVSSSTESSFQVPLNINTATEQELRSLPGIGEKLAERIIAYREENGAFSSIEEIMSVEGIGAKTYEELKSYITTD